MEASSPGVEEAREEIARLRSTIEEMERARGEAGDASGGCVDVAGRGGRNDEGEGEEGEGERRDEDEDEGLAAEGRRRVIAERDGLRAELGEEKRKSAVRVAGLETQLADKEVRLHSFSPPPPRPASISAPFRTGVTLVDVYLFRSWLRCWDGCARTYVDEGSVASLLRGKIGVDYWQLLPLAKG